MADPDALRYGLLALYRVAYRWIARPLIFRRDAQSAHEAALKLLARFDQEPRMLETLHRLVFREEPVTVGGVYLKIPVILAAGFVKGHGFETEPQAIAAVESDTNIIPGWRSVPALLGPVEFGSFTRHPRLGNPGTVVWRDTPGRSTQNRVGLKNPGATAAAEFLCRRSLPPVYGVNIAVSPGVSDANQEIREVVEAAQAFLQRGLKPSWLTINVSCPNTEDDPGDHQTETRTRNLCTALIEILGEIPLWVKIGPDLSVSQYQTLMRVFHEAGVRAVVATNTLGQPAPGNATVTAGLGGRRLHNHALDVVALLTNEKIRYDYQVDVVGCGGVINRSTYQDFKIRGAAAIQYWSALIFEGPLAPASMLLD